MLPQRGSSRAAQADSPASGRVKRQASRALSRGTAVYGRGCDWVEGQDPASRKGATLSWFRRYREADGQLYAVLLTAYIFVTLVPTAVVMASLLTSDPTALADRAVHRLDLHGSTATLFHQVLAGAGASKLVSTLLAVANVLVFGLGFGRVLQLAHARSWGIEPRKGMVTDQARYVSSLLVLVGGIVLYILQAKLLAGKPAWIEWALIPLWAVLVLVYFVWLPRLLLHGRVSVRDVLPGAVLTTLGLVAMRAASSLLLVHWLTWYSTYFGGLGVVMALFFWLVLVATILVVAAALSPALAERRDLLQARAVA